MNCEYVKNTYGVPACIGRRVIAYGKPGIIAEDRGHYIGVLLDSDKPGCVHNYHPVDGMEYGDMGRVRKMTPSQARYKRYLKMGECFDDFKHFLLWESAQKRECI